MPFLGNDAVLPELLTKYDGCWAALGLGHVDTTTRRTQLQEEIERLGFRFPAIVSPHAVVNAGVELGPGTVVFDGVVVNTGTVVGKSCILNTHCTVDHDGRLGNNVHIAPGATLSRPGECRERLPDRCRGNRHTVLGYLRRLHHWCRGDRNPKHRNLESTQECRQTEFDDLGLSIEWYRTKPKTTSARHSLLGYLTAIDQLPISLHMDQNIPENSVFIIAEAGVNHNGSADVARRLVEGCAGWGRLY